MKETAGGLAPDLGLGDWAPLRVSSGWISNKLLCMPHCSPGKLRTVILISWPVKMKSAEAHEVFGTGDLEHNACYHCCHRLYYYI